MKRRKNGTNPPKKVLTSRKSINPLEKGIKIPWRRVKRSAVHLLRVDGTIWENVKLSQIMEWNKTTYNDWLQSV